MYHPDLSLPMAAMCIRVLVVLLLLSGCGSADVESLSGTYVMHQTWNADTIVLRPDGRYVRSFRSQSAPSAVDSGAWRVTKNQKMIALHALPRRWQWVHDCMGIAPEKCTAMNEPNGLTLTIERSWYGARRLGWHSAFGWYYSRI